MTSLATEELLLRERSGQSSSETGGGSGVIQYADAKETAPCRIGDVLPGRASGETGKTLQPIASKTAETSANSRSIRGRDLLLIALYAYLGLAVFWFLCGFLAGIYAAIVSGTDPEAIVRTASQNVYFNGIAAASFYFAALLAMRQRLRKRRGHGPFASYFRPIGHRRVIYAALSGLLLRGLAFFVFSVLWWVVFPLYHPPIAKVIAPPHSLGRLAVFGFIFVVVGPFTEEMFFRGLLLEWLQQKLGPLSAASFSAAIFALWHLRFLEHPAAVGWTATLLIAAGGVLCALWAQRTHSLRAPIAVHATYNATIVPLFSW